MSTHERHTPIPSGEYCPDCGSLHREGSCWFNRSMDGHHCNRTATWRTDPALVKLQPSLAPFVWCDEHRHKNDVPIVDVDGVRCDANGIPHNENMERNSRHDD